MTYISIHALREEGDKTVPLLVIDDMDFYPRPPRGGRRLRQRPEHLPLRISIHALREEGDNYFENMISASCISIHALREEGDPGFGCCFYEALQFLSTPSARRATMPRNSSAPSQ